MRLIIKFFILFQLYLQVFSYSKVLINKCKSTKNNTDTDIRVKSIQIPPHLTSSNTSIVFNFDPFSLNCPSPQPNNLSLKLVEEFQEFEYEDENGTIIKEPYAVPPPASFEINGYLKIGEDGNKFYLRQHEYCVESLNDQEIVVQYCEASCEVLNVKDQKLCIPKCCSFGKFLDLDRKPVACEPLPNFQWVPQVHSKDASVAKCLRERNKSKKCLSSKIEEQHILYKQSFSGCIGENETVSFLKADNEFAILDSGKVHIKGEVFEMSEKDFCVDGVLNPEGSFIINHGLLHCSSLCVTQTEENGNDSSSSIDIFYIVTMFISSFFLLLTVIVYILIWDKHNIHGWTVFSLSVSMLFMLMFLGVSRSMSVTMYRNDASMSKDCIAVGILAHFFFLATFSFLTTLSFDLWYTFRTLAPSAGKSEGVQRFFLYVLFSIGTSFTIVIIGVILDAIGGENNSIGPGYGQETCYIRKSLEAKGFFLILPVGILLFFNTIFFGITLNIMYQYHKNTQAVRKNSNNQKQTLILFVKLFIVMGVTWSCEVFEYLIQIGSDDKIDPCSTPPSSGFFWIICDILNLCQGIAIFIIFVCKPSVLIHLMKRNEILRGKSSTQHNPSIKLNQAPININL